MNCIWLNLTFSYTEVVGIIQISQIQKRICINSAEYAPLRRSKRSKPIWFHQLIQFLALLAVVTSVLLVSHVLKNYGNVKYSQIENKYQSLKDLGNCKTMKSFQIKN